MKLDPSLGSLPRLGGSFKMRPPVLSARRSPGRGSTVYALTASNSLGVVTNFATVLVNPGGFASVSNLDATLGFTHALAPSAPDYSFNVSRQASVTIHLTRSGSNPLFIFNGSVSGPVSRNDREDEWSYGTLITSTTIWIRASRAVDINFCFGH